MRISSSPAIEPVSQWTIAEKYKQEKWEIEKKIFENPLEFSDFCFTPGNSKQNKASPV